MVSTTARRAREAALWGRASSSSPPREVRPSEMRRGGAEPGVGAEAAPARERAAG